MANDEQACYVYIQLPGTMETVPCASLKVRLVGAGAFEGTFTYGKRYLERPEVVALDPFHLPLSTRPQRFTKLKGIPGAVRDASADAWGRRVIQAKLQRPEGDIQEVEYLLNGPDDGAGNLSFGRTATPPAPRRPFNRTHQLPALIEAAEKLEEDGRLPHEILEELEPGTSMGGARPKVTVEDDHRVWLAKLPEKADRHNMQRIEYATLELARASGLRVCGTRLERVANRDALMLDRFDREWNPDANAYWRYGLVSGLTVIDAEDGYLGRERWSYPLLADELRRWSVKSNDDRRELFLRMVFNAMVTNNDDHPRNHALLQTRGGWRLSPAYDILPVPMVSVERRDLALEVGRFGRAASLYNILSHCDAFGLSKEEAQAMIDGMLAVVRGWREFFTERGVEQRSIEMLEPAMLPPSFFRDTPPGAV
ncbi:HipA domain-containing protein [Aquincola sp. S2]|uniref:HipA domain-containing protein n=1 Tax=Pseudaquabacterium terrae TaxID=2732868 RepID=A0ABX2EK69_9BURK|nr:HipA domain-containing protein [Aquabacterium terrae]NRF68998.1 HipA domain-containing protein [Aquabacterium terrae]